MHFPATPAASSRSACARTPVVISGNLGPRGDGYSPTARMTVAQAQSYHAPQIDSFARTDADMVAAFTMNYVEEAIGIVAAAKAAAMPVAISFTLETDGRLPSGDTLEHAITRADAETDGYPAYYMINCAHPTHFQGVLRNGGAWRERIRGCAPTPQSAAMPNSMRARTSTLEIPMNWAGNIRQSSRLLPRLSVVGGCCGTDRRHVAAICEALGPTRDSTPRA